MQKDRMAVKKIQDTIARYRNDILNGVIPMVNCCHPKELSALLSLSRPTVAQIYNTLKREGLIRKTPGLEQQ